MAGRPGGRPRGRGRGRDQRNFADDNGGFEDTLVKLYRCATVVKGGRRFSFGALVVVGNRDGQIGFGYGKANEVPPAVEKGVKQARRTLFKVPLRGTSIPHSVMGRFGASKIVLIPASEGTGVIAGAAPRAVLELAGVKDVLTKCYGSTSPKNLVKATINGLQALRTRATVEALRGVTLDLPPEPEPKKAEPAKRAVADEAIDKQAELADATVAATATAVAEAPPTAEPTVAPAVESTPPAASTGEETPNES